MDERLRKIMKFVEGGTSDKMLARIKAEEEIGKGGKDTRVLQEVDWHLQKFSEPKEKNQKKRKKK